MKHIIEFQEVGVDKKIKHPVDMNMPMPKKTSYSTRHLDACKQRYR